MPVLKVKAWGKDQGDYVLIEENDFDESSHELFDESKKEGKKTPKQKEVE